MKKYYFLFVFLLLSGSLSAKDVNILYNVNLIPDSLSKDAYVVIRTSSEEFDYISEEKGVYKVKIALTILKEKGLNYANFYYPGDRNKKLTDFSGKIYDAFGNLVSKVKKSDVQSTQWSEYLASDDLKYYYACSAPSLPFTVEYEYTVEFKNGFISFPAFFPQTGYNIAVQNATYTLIVPSDLRLLEKLFLLDRAEKSNVKNNNMYVWKINGLKAIDPQSFMPDKTELFPLLFVRPEKFKYDDIQGIITSDWNSMGKWEEKLLQGRQNLDDASKQKVRELTANATSEREKVKILYDYLGKTTHYQNIALGIGGFQPMQASEVCKVGFGDCKGLTNYLKAMLQEIGIRANFTVIKLSDTERDVYDDYPNFYQFNHAILQVPLPNDTLYLECTNPEVPFGFVHNGIAGHQALVMDESGGKLIRLPDYPDSLNIDKNISEITLGDEGKATGKSINICEVKVYDDSRYVGKLSHTKQIDYARRLIYLPTAAVNDVSFSEDKSSLPADTVKFNWETPRYGNKTGNRLFIPLNPLREMDNFLDKDKRKYDISIDDGRVLVDSITLIIPEDYEIETLPANLNYNSSFGGFASKIKNNGGKIIIYQTFNYNRGKWKAEEYPRLLELFETASKSYKSKIVLKHK